MSSDHPTPEAADPLQPLSLREAAAGDAPAVAALHTQSWQSAYRELLPDRYLDETVPGEHRMRWRSLLGAPPADGDAALERPEGVVRLAERDGRLLGFASVWFNYKPGYDAYMDNLHVRPDLRGGGIGGRLLRDAANQTAAAGYKSLSLEVLSGNQAAIRFYEKLGATRRREDREEMGGVLVDYWLMAWDEVSVLAEGRF